MQTTPASSVRWTTADLELFAGDGTNRYEIIDGELFVARSSHWKHRRSVLISVQLSRLGQMKVGGQTCRHT